MLRPATDSTRRILSQIAHVSGSDELPREGGSRSVPAPGFTMRVPSTTRSWKPALAVAHGEASAATQLGVRPPQRLPRGSQQTLGHATRHGRA